MKVEKIQTKESEEALSVIKDRKLKAFEAELSILLKKHGVKLCPVLLVQPGSIQGSIQAELI